MSGLYEALLMAQEQGVPTLHVYANTIQIPVLVLGPDRKRVAPIVGSRFSVSVDGGPRFRASHVRQEGDDPISLAILLDASGPEKELISKLSEAIAGLAPGLLHLQDHVSVYALGCELSRTEDDAPAERARLKDAVDDALRSSRIGRRHGPSCEQSVHLWDALTFVTNQMSGLPGRRVILAVTDGNDKGSSRKWNELRVFAQATAVAIFGMSYVPADPSHLQFDGRNRESAFDSICELSGGLVFPANRNDVAQQLRGFLSMVRGRYIVEFPRPYNSTRGQHELIVTIDKSGFFIRAAGISVPVPDSKMLADPTTVRSNPSLAPEQGTHQILTTPQ